MVRFVGSYSIVVFYDLSIFDVGEFETDEGADQEQVINMVFHLL